MLQLQDIMNTEVKTIDADEPAQRAFESMKEWSVRHLLVVDAGRVVGVISDRDLGGAKGKAARETKRVFDLMTTKPFCAEGTMTVREAARKMRKHEIGSLPIVRDNQLVGVVTVADLLELIAKGVQKPAIRADRRPLSRRSARIRTGS